MFTEQLLIASRNFYAKPRNISFMFSNNGIFKIEFEALKSPVYFRYTIREYNKDTKKFEFYSSYGSPFAYDVCFNLCESYKLN